jgi:hypothetical protein
LGLPTCSRAGRAVRAPCRLAQDVGARGKTECRRGRPDVRALALPFSFESTSYKVEHVVQVFGAYMHMDDCGHCSKLCQYKVSCPHHRLNEPLLCLWHRHHPLSPVLATGRRRSQCLRGFGGFALASPSALPWSVALVVQHCHGWRVCQCVSILSRRLVLAWIASSSNSEFIIQIPIHHPDILMSDSWKIGRLLCLSSHAYKGSGASDHIRIRERIEILVMLFSLRALLRYKLYLIRGKMSNKYQPFIFKILTKIR